MRLLIWIAISIATASSVVNGRNASGPSHGKFVVCSALAEPLFPIDLIYSFFGLSQFDKLNLDLCTHLIYIDLALSEHKDAFDTEVLHRSDYNRIELLRQKHPHLKISLGLIESSYNFFEIASKPLNRREFIRYITNFILINRLDGLDLTWIDSMSIFTNDANDAFIKQNITLFLKEFSETFKPYKLQLTSSFSLGQTLSDFYDYPLLSKYLEFMQIFNPNQIENLLKLGIPSRKLILGIMTITGFRTFNFFNIDSYILHSRYDEICELLANNKILSKFYDPLSQGMIAEYVNEDGITHTINFESTRTIANKTRAAIKWNLGGVSMLTVDMDDPYGKCATEQDTFVDFKPNDGVTLNIPTRQNNTFPLLKTINDAIWITLDELRQEYTNTNKITNRNLLPIDGTTGGLDWSTIVTGIIDNFASG